MSASFSCTSDTVCKSFHFQCKNPKWNFACPVGNKCQQRRNLAKAQWARDEHLACGWRWSCALEMWQQREISWWELPRGTVLHLQTCREVRSMPSGQDWNWGLCHKGSSVCWGGGMMKGSGQEQLEQSDLNTWLVCLLRVQMSNSFYHLFLW